MKHEDNNLPHIEALIRELSQLMGPDAKTRLFEKIFSDIALHRNRKSGSQ